MKPYANIAVLALVYRELAQPAESTRDISVLGKMGFDALLGFDAADSEFEWMLSEAAERPYKLLPLIEELSEVEPLRAEALLHAFPPSDGLPNEPSAWPYRGRWIEVVAAMR